MVNPISETFLLEEESLYCKNAKFLIINPQFMKDKKYIGKKFPGHTQYHLDKAKRYNMCLKKPQAVIASVESHKLTIQDNIEAT